MRPTDRVLVDAGPLVALIHRDDQFHALCAEQARHMAKPFYTSWAVLAEAAWLVRSLSGGLDQVLAFLDAGLVTPVDLDRDASSWMRTYAAKYADLHPQLADLTLCYLAQRDEFHVIFTTDRRDFSVFRLDGGRSLVLLPEAIPT